LWSSDLTPSNSPNSADNSFKVSHYGYLTANFRQASTVTIPTDLLYGVILGPTIGSITAWLIPFFWDRMRKSKDLQDVMIHIGIIDRTYETALRNRGECLDLLRRKRADITRLFERGKISDSTFQILNDRISQYFDEINNDNG
jgi:hypothetical protein